MPPGQSARYLLIVAFLRGATNPPPKNWFFQSPTWDKKGAEGMTVTAPEGAQHDIARIAVFLASYDSAWLTGERLTASGGYR